MPLETGTTIAQLVSSNPLSSDNVSEGDDHLRLIKAVLKAQFPGAGLQGFNTPITATEAELNFLSGVTSNVQDQLNTLTQSVNDNAGALLAPAGTRMIFNNNSAPVGWTQDTGAAMQNSMMRVVDINSVSSGGTDNPISYDHTHVVEGHVLSVGELPSHSHPAVDGGNFTITNAGTQFVLDGGNDFAYKTSTVTDSTGSDEAHDHSLTALDVTDQFTPKYIDVIVAVKD